MSDRYLYPRSGSPSEERYWNSTREIEGDRLGSPLPSLRQLVADGILPRSSSAVAVLSRDEPSPQLAYQPNTRDFSPRTLNNHRINGGLGEPILPFPINTTSESPNYRAARMPVHQPVMRILQAPPSNHAHQSDSASGRGQQPRYNTGIPALQGAGAGSGNVTRRPDTSMAFQSSVGHQRGYNNPFSTRPASQQIMGIDSTSSSNPIPEPQSEGTRKQGRLWELWQDAKILEMRDNGYTWPEIAAEVGGTQKQIQNRYTILDRKRKAGAAVEGLQLNGIPASAPQLTVLKRSGKGQVDWTADARNWLRNRVEVLCSEDAEGDFSKSMALEVIAGELNRRYETTLTARMLRTQLSN